MARDMSVDLGRGRSLLRVVSRSPNILTERGMIRLLIRDRCTLRGTNLANTTVVTINLLHDGRALNRIGTINKTRTMAPFLAWTPATLSTFEPSRHDRHTRQSG